VNHRARRRGRRKYDRKINDEDRERDESQRVESATHTKQVGRGLPRREVVFGVGFALLLPLFWQLTGVLYSMPVSDFLTLIASIIVIFKTYKTLGA
jgi:hypothetical protein